MTAPKSGDSVRVVLEGEARGVGKDGFEIGPGARANYISPSAPHVVSVEVIPPPEPTYGPGDIVRSDLDGCTYLRRTHHDVAFWQIVFPSYDGQRTVPDVVPMRPLTLLVRDGKPVSA